jgi:hypothetical protein
MPLPGIRLQIRMERGDALNPHSELRTFPMRDPVLMSKVSKGTLNESGSSIQHIVCRNKS